MKEEEKRHVSQKLFLDILKDRVISYISKLIHWYQKSTGIKNHWYQKHAYRHSLTNLNLNSTNTQKNLKQIYIYKAYIYIYTHTHTHTHTHTYIYAESSTFGNCQFLAYVIISPFWSPSAVKSFFLRHSNINLHMLYHRYLALFNYKSNKTIYIYIYICTIH